LHLPRAERIAWGAEMGHRMRDDLRAAERAGVKVDSFQLDEIWPSASDHTDGGKAALQFLVGVLGGVHSGRNALGDKPMTGLVHVAHPAKVAALAHDADGQAFFANLAQVASYWVAEEYPSFS